MARLKKSNRIIDVQPEFLDGYLMRGYDQIDEKGTVIKRATGGRNVSVGQFNAVSEELEALKAEVKKLKAENVRTKKAE